MLETALKTLFDYQRLEQNAALQEVIGAVLDKYAQKELIPIADDRLAYDAGGVREITEEDLEPKYDGRGKV